MYKYLFITHENFQGMKKKEETEIFRESTACFIGKMTRRESDYGSEEAF